MISLNYTIFGASGKSHPIQSEYQAILDKATSLGYTLPDEEQRRLDNNVIFYLKQEGLWNEMDLLYMFRRSVSLANFATLNWKNPNAFQLTSSNPNLFIDNVGFSGGVGKYLNTNYTPSVHGVKALLNNCGYFFKTNGAGTPQSVYGTRNSSNNNLWRSNSTSYLSMSTAGGGLIMSTSLGSVLDVKSGTAHKSYNNGNFVASGTFSSTTNSTFPLVLFALNNGGTIQNISTSEFFRLEYFGNGSAFLESKQLELYKILNHLFE